MIRNLRDLGGIIGADGKKIKKGHFFRSARLNEIDDKDLEWFKDNNITLVIDLRTQTEVERNPDYMIPGTEYSNHYLVDTRGKGLDFNKIRKQLAEAKTEEERLALVPDLRVVYRQMVTSDYSRERFAELIRSIITYDKGAVLFHCTSGKDRTGMTAAALCMILGVDREYIYDDYLISLAHAEWEAAKMKESFKKEGVSDELADKLTFLFKIDKSYLDAYYEEIENMYGNEENYVRDGLGVNDEQVKAFRSKYLE